MTSRHQWVHAGRGSGPSASMAPPVACSRAASTSAVAPWATTASRTKASHGEAVTARATQPGQAARAPLTARATVPTTSRATTWSGSSPGIHPRAKLATVKGSRRTGKKALTTSTAKAMLTARNTQATPPYNTVRSPK